MGTIFISHSSRNNEQAIRVRDWLRVEGWGDTFLDLDPARGLAPGQRWQEELKKAGERCSAVVVLVSPDWSASTWCRVEFLLASQLGKRIFGVIIAHTPFAELPIELTAHYQLVDISDPAHEAEGFERLRFGLQRAGLDPKSFPWPPQTDPDRSPYRGLRTMEAKDAAVFFGRDAPITRGLDTLRRMRDGAPERMLIVLGASGAGKSSFLKAGVLARLERDPEHFLVLPAVRPERAALTGPHGLLSSFGLSSVPTKRTLYSRFAALRAPVISRLTRSAEAARESYATKPPTLVLPIDQAEELFASDNPESTATLDLLLLAFEADDNLLSVVTIRSDSYARLQNELRLADIPRLPFDLPRLSAGAFKEIIEGPGRLVSPTIGFQPALTDRLVADLDDADALPLLAFTLERLVATRSHDGDIQLDDYERGLGGLGGAIAKAIEAAFAAGRPEPSLPDLPIELERLARRALIPWLIRIDDAEGAPARRVATLNELPAETRPLVHHLVDQRLLISDRQGDEVTIEVSHEAVLRHWSALSVWINEERAMLRTLEEVRVAASEWRRHSSTGASPDRKGSESWLVHRGERLLQAETLLQGADYSQILGEEGRAYLEACRAQHDAEHAAAEERMRREQRQLERQRSLQRRVAAALAMVAVVVAAFGYFVAVESRRASRQVSFLLVDYARRAISEGLHERATRFAALAAREGPFTVADAAAAPTLAAAARESSLLFEVPGHEEVTLLESPDGRLVLSWGDGIARVWDAASGAEIARQTHQSVQRAIFSSDSKRVVSWGWDQTARVWDATSGSEIARQTHESSVDGAAFSPDGEKVLSWDGGGTARVWDATSGRETARQTHKGVVRGAIFSADGGKALSWGTDDTARVWAVGSGTEIARQTHQGVVSRAVFSPDAARVLSWGLKDGMARVWDAASGKEIARQTHDGVINGAVFASDGERVLSWDETGIARVWTVASGSEIARHAHGARVLRAVFSADDERVLSSSGDGTVRVWSATTGEEIARQLHEGRPPGGGVLADVIKRLGSMTDAEFAADGRRVLSWGEDGTARVWDALSGTLIAFQVHEERVTGAEFSRDGERVLSWGWDGTARVWTAASGVEIARQTHQLSPDGGIVLAAFTADGERVLSWDSGGNARVWAAAASDWKTVRQWHEDGVVGAAFTAGGERVLSWGEDGTAKVWTAATGREIARQTHEDGIVGAVFSTDGERVLSWGGDGTVKVWTAATGREIARQTHGSHVFSAVFSPDGERVLSSDSGGTARVWAARTGTEITRQAHEIGFQELRELGLVITGTFGSLFAADGERVLSWAADGTARVWAAASGMEIARRTHESPIRGAVFAADGERVLSWDDKGTALVWAAATGTEISRHTHDAEIIEAVFAADGEHVLSWGVDGTARVWSAASGMEIARQKHEYSVKGAAFSPNGERILSWSEEDHIVRLWSAASGVEIARHTHESGVAGAAFATDGERVLSWGHDDGIARVWAAGSGAEMAQQKHTDKVHGAVFAPDGKRVLSWDEDGMVAVWDVSWSVPRASNDSLIAEVCERRLRGSRTTAPAVATGRETMIARAAISRITDADAIAAPLLQDRIGEDVCSPPGVSDLVRSTLRRAFLP